MGVNSKPVDYLVVDTTAFIRNAPLQETNFILVESCIPMPSLAPDVAALIFITRDKERFKDIAQNIITCPEVVNEITNKRQLRRLVVLPYDLIVREVFPESIKIVTDFSKRTGDYVSLSATDIKVMALTYQLEKEKVGVDHLRTEPVAQKPFVTTNNSHSYKFSDVTGFVLPGETKTSVPTECDQNEQKIKKTDLEISDEKLAVKFKSMNCEVQNISEEYSQNCNLLASVCENNEELETDQTDGEDDGWITPTNVHIAKKQINSELSDDRHVMVACMTTDFAMQNVLRQINLNVTSLDGRVIKQLRTFILRCYTCFKTTSIMTKRFCPNCGNNTLKKVAVSLDEDGKLQIHINTKRPLSARGKKFSVPRIKGGKHPNNPILVEDQPLPHNRPSRLARTKNNPLDDDYIAGYSPFVMRDINSKSAQLCIRPGQEFKNWLKKNPNECRKKKK